MIKLFEPDVGIEEIKSVENVLLSKLWASGTGTGKVLEFENNFLPRRNPFESSNII